VRLAHGEEGGGNMRSQTPVGNPRSTLSLSCPPLGILLGFGIWDLGFIWDLDIGSSMANNEQV